MTGGVDVIQGPVALRERTSPAGGRWMGYASGTRATGVWRRTAAAALKDAARLEGEAAMIDEPVTGQEELAKEWLIQRNEWLANELERLRDDILARGWWREAPCALCGYDGAGYYQPETHSCVGLIADALARKVRRGDEG